MMGVYSSKVLLLRRLICLWVSVIGFVQMGAAVAHREPQQSSSICDVKGCNCTSVVASLKTINCTLSPGQELDVQWGHLPQHVNEIFISGGDKVTLGPKSLAHLPALTALQVANARAVSMESQSIFNLTHPSLHIQIRNCDRLTIKTGAIENVQSSINVEVLKCVRVSLAKSAFSKLESAWFKDIKQLELEAGTFKFRNLESRGPHGPVTVISFDNVTIPKIPQQTFCSALSEVLIENSHINDVHKEAFTAPQISAITITNTKIDNVRGDAFTQNMLLINFRITKCTIARIESKAIMAGIANLTVQNSSITEIETGAINNTVAKFELIGNEIVSLQPAAIVLRDWNTILIEQNIIKYLHTSFLVALPNTQVADFTFDGNDIYHLDQGALSFVPDLDDKYFHVKNNFFNQSCYCYINDWLVDLITANLTDKVTKLANNTFCNINDLLSSCFQLPVGIINIKNFTDLVCNTKREIVCERYIGETKIVNTTSKIFSEPQQPKTTHWLTLIISCTSVLLLAFVATTIIMLIRGSRWLKRKGYFRKIQYNHNEHSDENTIETVDENDKLDISEDLTMELLEYLKKRLDDPDTHQEASEQIEQLYQKYIHSSDNNNQQDEEAHLYEELGNLQQNAPMHPDQAAAAAASAAADDDGPRSILRIMEEKFMQFNEEAANPPAVVNDYSEPSDAAVHLYSELKKEADSQESTLKSKGSGSSMAFRPLPDKPGPSKSTN